MTTRQEHGICANLEVFLANCTYWSLKLLRALLLLAVDFSDRYDRDLFQSFLSCWLFMMLVLLGRHFQNTSQKILIITCSIRSKVLGEVGSKVMRVESKEGRHTHESIILKYRPEAKGPKEISYELIFIHDSISIEWISKSLRVSLDRTMPNLWTETHEEV